MEPELVKTALSLLAALLSGVFGLLSWIALREIKKREEADKELKLELQTAVKDLRTAVKEEAAERVRIDEQLFSKVNSIQDVLKEMDSMMLSHQRDCQGVYFSREEYDRMEKLKDRIEEQKKEQDRRLESNLQSVMSLLQDLLRNGRRRT
jgi:hypothetical protein